MRVIASGIVAIAASAIALAQAAPQAKAELKDASGKAVGTAILNETPHGVLVRVSLINAPTGVHALHIHQTGKCEPPFETAGGHFNPGGRQHGIDNAAGMHAGDLPNINVPAGGQLTFDLFAPTVSLRGGSNSLVDADGSALVLHQGADDYKSDPAGNAGARIACGVVTK